MKINIISYNYKKVKIGMFLSHIGLLFLLCNCIPFIWGNYGMFVVAISIFLLASGAGIVGYYNSKTVKIGELIIAENSTEIKVNPIKIEIVNKEYKVNFSNTGYKGKSNYIPFLTIGAFTTNPGLNFIVFFNDTNEYKYEVLIKSNSELKEIKSILTSSFKR